MKFPSSRPRLRELRPVIRYAVFGVFGLSLDYGIFILLVHLLIPSALASGIGYLCGTAITFLLNARFTFGVSNRMVRRFGRFFMVAGVSAALSSLLIAVFEFFAPSSGLLLKVAVTTPFLAIQFVVNSRWTFLQAENWTKVHAF